MRGNTIGTYLHGPLLPSNAWFADWLIARALRNHPAELAPLEDELEAQVHLGARGAAGTPHAARGPFFANSRFAHARALPGLLAT